MVYTVEIVRPQPKRRTRGLRPRGPKPQVCDLCQLRKVKCDRAMPRCSLCQKVNKPCSYDRAGFGTPVTQDIPMSDSLPSNGSFVKAIVRLSFSKRTQMLVDCGENYIYIGSSMAAHYLAANSRLLSGISKPALPVITPVNNHCGLPFEMTRTLVQQLIELYFAYLNAFYPVVDPIKFYSQLNKGQFTHEFLFLFNTVCLSGASYYPNRTFGRIIARHFATRTVKLLKLLIFKPTLQILQACLLVAYHINVCEEPLLESGWFVLGIARSMAIMLGVTKNQPGLTPSERQARRRIWWVLNSAEVILSHCFGRPFRNQLENVPIPSADFLLPNLSFIHSSVFIVKEISQTDSASNAKYFNNFCYYIKLSSRLAKLRTLHEATDAFFDARSRCSLENLLCHSGRQVTRPFLLGCLNTEKDALKWYSNWTLSNTRISFPEPSDIHSAMLSTLFFSFLIDLNKPFIRDDQTISESPTLDFDSYLSSSPLSRCLNASLAGCQVIFSCQDRLFEIGVPCVWYTVVQFAFFSLYLVHTLSPSHWAWLPAKQNALKCFRQFEFHSDRWAILRETYFLFIPFVRTLESLPTITA